MNDYAPFNRSDLAELDERFLSRASAVVAMRDIHEGNHDPTVIGMRHDCDSGHALANAVAMAEWENDRGYRSTYYMLHTSAYWRYPHFRASLEQIAGHGHEIGIHANALAEAMRTGGDPHEILADAIGTLRSWGHEVVGVAGHGDPFCNRAAAKGEPWFTNDEQFAECPRPKLGEPTRWLTRGDVRYRLNPRPLAEFGLAYEAITVSLAAGMPVWRVSDSAGRWKHADYEPTFDEAAALFDERLSGVRAVAQLQMLVHPDHWSEAFAPAVVAA